MGESPQGEAPQGSEEAREPMWERRSTLIWMLVIAAIVLIGRLTPFQPVQDFFGAFGWLTKQALEIAKDLFESYGYLTAFLAPLLENTLFIGAIIPGTLVMLLAGLAAEDGLLDIRLAIPLSILGAWIGDTISYGMGRFGFSRLGPESRMVRWSERMREPLLDQSSWVVFLYHFTGYGRTIGPTASGFLRVPFGRWILLDYAGAALWVVVFMSLGYTLGVFGLSLDSTDGNVRIFEVILFVLAAIGVVLLINRAEKRAVETKANEEQEAISGPP